MVDLLAELLAELTSPPKKTRRTRRNHSLYLDSANLKAFKALCEARGTSASEVLDRFIARCVSPEKEGGNRR